MFKVTHQNKGHRNSYCAPAALSALTGINAEQAALLLRHVSGKTAIRGVGLSHIERALDKLGLKWKKYPCHQTIKQWMKRKPSGKILCNITGHFICVQGRKFWDNSNPEGAALKNISRKRIKYMYTIEGRANKQVIRDLEKTAKTSKKSKNARRYESLTIKTKIDKLVKENGLQCTTWENDIEVHCPTGKHFQSSGLHSMYDRFWPDDIVQVFTSVLEDIEFGISDCEPDCDCFLEEEE